MTPIKGTIRKTFAGVLELFEYLKKIYISMNSEEKELAFLLLLKVPDSLSFRHMCHDTCYQEFKNMFNPGLQHVMTF